MIKKYIDFIYESKFLKDVSTLGYLDKSFYPGIDAILSNIDKQEILSSQDTLLWNYNSEETTEKINEFTFKVETETKFDLEFLNFTREPIEVETFTFKDFVNERVNHYMIKSNNSSELFLGIVENSESIKDFISTCFDKANQMRLDTDSRYCYLTIDQMIVETGKSQRESGWHIDGMQGLEVSEKQPADYQFIWADATPTKFCTQTFDVEGIDVGKHNVFNWVSKQVAEKNCYLLKKETIYLMNAYHVHTATQAEKKLYRRFVRLSFTNTPITSIKMTINPDIKYNYKIGVTSGDIPKNLI
jgi:hypothetical protein